MRLDRRQLLTAGAAAFGLPLLSAASAGSRRLLIVFAEGGWNTLFALDPKQGIPWLDGPMADEREIDPLDREQVVTYGNIPIQVNERKRPELDALFTAHHGRICVVNGIWVGGLTHFESRVRMITGTIDRDAPDIATAVGVVHGGSEALGTVDFSGLARFGSYAASTVRFGLEGQMRALLDPLARPRSDDFPDVRGFTFDDQDRAALQAYLVADPAADPIAALPGGAEALAARAEALDRAQRMRGVPMPGSAVPTMSAQLTAAVDLLAAGTCHAAMVRSDGYWDTHIAEASQHLLWNSLATGLKGLFDDLVARGLADTVTVVVVSEMGRTPIRNGDDGSDHWPHTSALLFGAGVRGDSVAGASDDGAHSRKLDFATGEATDSGEWLRPENLVAGLMETMDVDPGDWLPGAVPFRGFQS